MDHIRVRRIAEIMAENSWEPWDADPTDIHEFVEESGVLDKPWVIVICPYDEIEGHEVELHSYPTEDAVEEALIGITVEGSHHAVLGIYNLDAEQWNKSFECKWAVTIYQGQGGHG